MNAPNQSEKADKISIIALILGIAALFVMGLAVLLGIFIDSIGIASFLNPVLILGLAAIICGISGRRKAGGRLALWGLVLGCIALFLSLFARIAIFIFFIPWLGA